MEKQAEKNDKQFIHYFIKDHHLKASFFYILALSLIIFGCFLDSPERIVQGLVKMISSPSNLITDYFVLAGEGATFVNVGALLFLSTWMVNRSTHRITGSLTAALLTVTGFAFFGKNLFNTLSLTLGAYLYSRYRGQAFATVLLSGLFATTLAPAISFVAFASPLPLAWGLPLSQFLGIFIGFIIVPIASSFMRFHQGYSLYNMGFTAGVIGMLFASILKVFNIPIRAESYQAHEVSSIIFYFFVGLCLLFILLGLFYKKPEEYNYRKLLKHSGRMVADFFNDYGSATTLFNMGLLGLLALAYIKLVGGVLNGPVIGGVLTIIGFSAFGKHPRNVIPVLIGVFSIQIMMPVDQPGTTSGLLTALFGTTLAPLAGTYGWLAGIVAGLLHGALVSNVTGAHAGLNLYNNGFAGAFVAATLMPLFDAIKERSASFARISKN